MRTHITALLAPLLLVAGLSSCQSTNVVIDYDTSADFSHMQNYAWFTETSGSEQGFDPLIAERARKAVAVQLQQLPLPLAASGVQADVLVRYYVGTYTRSQGSKSSGSIGFGSAGGSTALGLALSFPLGGDKIVKEAQIVVDFVNPSDKKLMWRGTNRIKIGDDSPEQITDKINQAVTEIFSHYPPDKSAQ